MNQTFEVPHYLMVLEGEEYGRAVRQPDQFVGRIMFLCPGSPTPFSLSEHRKGSVPIGIVTSVRHEEVTFDQATCTYSRIRPGQIVQDHGRGWMLTFDCLAAWATISGPVFTSSVTFVPSLEQLRGEMKKAYDMRGDADALAKAVGSVAEHATCYALKADRTEVGQRAIAMGKRVTAVFDVMDCLKMFLDVFHGWKGPTPLGFANHLQQLFQKIEWFDHLVDEQLAEDKKGSIGVAGEGHSRP